ncbi:MAG TPA: NAD-dependent epimerase/dehydratase family protein [Desulfobacterales bacterium]|nr:NAD-dependent epimerase/dehydratase family protein [Desulfobacterales bacterium]
MKVFVTGATGFIGSHLVKRLVQDGHNITCLVRPTSKIEPLKTLGVNLIFGDVTKKDTVVEGMVGCDFVVNLANLYSFWEPDKQRYTQVNVDGTQNVMLSALESSITKVVHVSTYGIYGKPVDCPFTEQSQVVPSYTCEYARTKYTGDLIAWKLYEKHGLPLAVVYPCNVLGAGDTKITGQYIRDIIRCRLPATIFEDTIFTFVHVNDVVEAIVRVLEKPDNIGQKYIIGKYQMSMREINQLIQEISGVPLPKMHMPDFLAAITAAFCTFVANLIKKPPPWGMCTDQIKSMKESFRADGRKAEKELDIDYTPIHIALEEAIASYQG